MTNTISSTLVPESERMATADKLFGLYYILGFEPAVYTMAENLSPQYNGGYWEFHTVSNGAFFMAPRANTIFKVSARNGFKGGLSANAFGLGACLRAYLHLSVGDGRLAVTCAEQYHLLRAFVMDHSEKKSILAAID